MNTPYPTDEKGGMIQPGMQPQPGQPGQPIAMQPVAGGKEHRSIINTCTENTLYIIINILLQHRQPENEVHYYYYYYYYY